MSPLSELTIIIPTYNRQRYALRNMILWSGTEATIHVLDGSAVALNENQLSKFSSNIHYHHLPVSFWMRLAKIDGLVDTEYVVLLGDDDCIIPSAVESCVVELKQNFELIACSGWGIDKCLTPDLIVSSAVLRNNIINYLAGVTGEVFLEDPIDRMVFHMNPYHPFIIYAVCRSNAWLKTMKLLSDQQFSSGVVSELQFELAMSFYGKSKVINELLFLRSAENPSSTIGFELEVHDWYMDDRYSNEVDEFLNITANDLAEGSKLEFDVIRKGLKVACNAYMEFCDKNYTESNQSLSNKKTLSFLASTRFLKKSIKKIISSLPELLINILPVSLRFRPYLDIAQQLQLSGLSVDFNQLKTILIEVKKTHENK